MINRDTLSTNQITLSYELLCLIQWILEHESDKLKKMISKALEAGLKEELQKADEALARQDLPATEDIQYTIIDFFSLLESLLTDCVNEQVIKKAVERNLIPTIDQIDSTACDDATVRDSVDKATFKVENNPTENPKEMLYKELLKRWKPLKSTMLN